MTEKELAEKEKDLNKREAGIVLREQKAANQYQELFVQKFKEVSEPLTLREKYVSEREANVAKKETELATELSQTRINRLKEIEAECSSLRNERMQALEKDVAVRLDTVQRQIVQMQNSANADIEKRRKEAIFINDTKCAELEKLLSEANEKLVDFEKSAKENLKQTVENLQSEIKNLEASKIKAETNLIETESKNEVLKNSIKEICSKNSDEISTLQNEITKLQSELASQALELKKYETLQNTLEGNSPSQFLSQIASLSERENELRDEQSKFRDEKSDFEFEKKRFERQKEEFSDERLEEKVEKKWSERITSYENQRELLKQEISRLRSEYSSDKKMIEMFEDMKTQLGENPAELLGKYERVKVELQEAMEKLADTPSDILKKEFADLKRDRDALEQKYEDLRRREKEFAERETENAEIAQSRDVLQKEKNTLLMNNDFLEQELERLTATYGEKSNRDERIKAINEPLITKTFVRMDKKTSDSFDEKNWLSDIRNKMQDFGIVFPKRIVNAFHTSLKCAEMSPLTVLAGVSGTGKSELPRLYSHFGGLNFLSVPVQPNWDSQEAMLGYFNSIDNCFDAQDVLKLLAQTQRKETDANGLDDVMTLILLDEMNLANVELYFSDFLSKLETRRGLSDKNVPTLGVKIGAKMDDWQLPLGRNVLWCGTMNQDETTKTLSDKVLDRGIVISFPSPKILERRVGNKSLEEGQALLPRAKWTEWLQHSVNFTDEQIKDYKLKVQEINSQLGKTGRALGHRVWQSIESYMSLYPDVVYAADEAKMKNAMDVAFEDQLVQKVMPKLRGIEVRGEQGKVLGTIKTLIPENLHEDFENAKSLGYGQFMWCSSNYLLAEEKTETNKNDEAENTQKKNTKAEAEAPAKNGEKKK